MTKEQAKLRDQVSFEIENVGSPEVREAKKQAQKEEAERNAVSYELHTEVKVSSKIRKLAHEILDSSESTRAQLEASLLLLDAARSLERSGS